MDLTAQDATRALAEALADETHCTIIPRVRKCNLEHFKNRFSPDENLYAVDVLESESTEIGPQMQEELQLRRRRTKDKGGNPGVTRERAIHFGPSGKNMLLRIRIQAPSLLRILSAILTEEEELWTTKPRTFIRPFTPLIYRHERVCAVLADLEKRWGSMPSTPRSGQEALPVDDCPAAVAELRCYVEFMNEEVIPIYHRYDNMSSDDDGQPRIRFNDLWCLFRVGELVYRPVGNGTTKEQDNTSLGNRTWRCYGTRPFWVKYRVTPSDVRSYTGSDDSEQASFGVHCYYIDYTGDEYCVVTDTFEIAPFKGEKAIKSLKVFPYRFATDHQKLMQSTIANATAFLQITKKRHAAYSGFTTTRTPKGGPTTDIEGNEVRQPEFIDSEVIVDFGKAFEACPAWKPEATVIRPIEFVHVQVADDDFSICWWSDHERTKLVKETSEMIIIRSSVTACERNFNLSHENRDADRFLIKIRSNDRNGRTTTEEDLSPEDYPLLPSRIFAYGLRGRKFLQLVVQNLKPVKKSDDAFRFLQINPQYKSTLQSLVEDHFDRKSSDRAGGVDIQGIDIIRGKGRGLFILLHGVPGVGKTATAEAIAAANGKPLFPITCGDLGLTPSEVEKNLQRIFWLADTWNCVLLLDEVDTFFSQRAKGDATLAKNALVSVFLRVLEYYDGLLFLTTNRPGSLDEAFKSRIHLQLYYSPLSREQTMDIWRMNIQRLERIEAERSDKTGGARMEIHEHKILRFAEKMFQKQKRQNRWNGRQIRNAFQVASSLAHYDARKANVSPELTVKHFKLVKGVTEDFDDFMHETLGKDEADMAFERGDRADHFVARRDREREREQERFPEEDEDEEASMAFTPRGSGAGGYGGRQRSTSFNRQRSLSPPGSSRGHPASSGGFFGPAAGGYGSSRQKEKPRIQLSGGGGGDYSRGVGGSSLRRYSDERNDERDSHLSPDHLPRGVEEDHRYAPRSGRYAGAGRSEYDRDPLPPRSPRKVKDESDDESSG
ncbi:hypothetical protein QBC35DRAFT_498874 [Podospora australis]|uniref:AAA+ ATPase domain-containing protein n=1 Tax=Podospora australis TaxID=1536484 RepID=A0AAN7AI23_9PEZI|nr:hypothetical protein QBC35DRAFT_498874 [Podospora australis]